MQVEAKKSTEKIYVVDKNIRVRRRSNKSKISKKSQFSSESSDDSLQEELNKLKKFKNDIKVKMNKQNLLQNLKSSAGLKNSRRSVSKKKEQPAVKPLKMDFLHKSQGNGGGPPRPHSSYMFLSTRQTSNSKRGTPKKSLTRSKSVDKNFKTVESASKFSYRSSKSRSKSNKSRASKKS